MARTRANQEVGRRGGGAHRLGGLWTTTLGKKLVVAGSGTILALYVVAHMLGNLKTLQGAGDPSGDPAIDRYAEWLRTLLGPVLPREGVVWATRAILLIALIAHVTAITQLWRRNRKAKPPAHRAQRYRSTIAARTMTITGGLLLLFIVFHILHFTTRTIHPTPLAAGEVYSGVYGAFQEWWLVLLYVAAVGLLGFHLHHALWSAAQTAGWDNPYRNWFWRRFASVMTVAVVVGFCAPPVLLFAGALPEPHASTHPETAVIR